jgi:hypothetical protein
MAFPGPLAVKDANAKVKSMRIAVAQNGNGNGKSIGRTIGRILNGEAA